MSKVVTYKATDIFTDIGDNKDTVNMNIPPEIAKRMGWEPGDILNITNEGETIIINKVTHGD